MLIELGALTVAGCLGAAIGRAWTQHRLSRIVTRLHVLLDSLGAPVCRMNTAPTRFAVADSDRLDLEAQGMYQEGLEAWTPAAMDRLLTAMEEVPVCESCQKGRATHVVTWADVDAPGGSEFIVCAPCAAILPGGTARIEPL